MALSPNDVTVCTCGNSLNFLGLGKGFEKSYGPCQRRDAFKNKSSWNKGLTKNNDARMAKSATNMQKHYAEHGHHNTDKTKKNSELVRQKGKNKSITSKPLLLS